MKNKSSLLIISLLVLSGLMMIANTPVQAQEDDHGHTIYIGVVEGANQYNVTEVELEGNTEYTIVFVNNDATASHNLRIDVNNNIEDGDIADSEDILIGAPNDSDDGMGGSDAMWNMTWTTPESGDVTYYCGYAGHYAAGMEGTFIVGGGADSPGFGLFAGLAAVVFTALAIPRLRRN